MTGQCQNVRVINMAFLFHENGLLTLLCFFFSCDSFIFKEKCLIILLILALHYLSKLRIAIQAMCVYTHLLVFEIF